MRSHLVIQVVMMCQECVETRVLVRGNEDETMGGHRTQQQQQSCHPAYFMRGATAYIKWETSDSLELNNIILKPLTTTEISNDSLSFFKSY